MKNNTFIVVHFFDEHKRKKVASILFNSVYEAGKILNMNYSHLRQLVNKDIKTSKLNYMGKWFKIEAEQAEDANINRVDATNLMYNRSFYFVYGYSL